MKVNIKQLVKNLGICFLVLYSGSAFGAVGSFLKEFSSNTTRIFYNKKSILSVSRNSAKKYDYYFKSDRYEIKEFNNKYSRYLFFLHKNELESLLLGISFDFLTQKKTISVFRFQNGFRYDNDRKLCESKNVMSTFSKIESEYAAFLENLDPVPLDDLFDEKSCGGFKHKDKILKSLMKSVKVTNDNFKKCFLGSETSDIKSELENNDEFRRIMLTYYTNALEFTKAFFSGKKVVQFDCSQENIHTKIKPGNLLKEEPHQITLKKEYGQDMKLSQIQKLNDEFSEMILHETHHVFFQIPKVVDANTCEHKYKNLVASNCNELSKFKKGVPDCPLGNSNFATTIVSMHSTGQSLQEVGGAQEKDRAITQATGQTVDPTPLHATGDTQLASTTGVRENGSNVSTHLGLSVVEDRSSKIDTKLTPRQETVVTQAAESVFGPAISGNTRVRDETDKLFRTQDPVAESRHADRIAREYNRTLSTFGTVANGVKAALGENTYAATVSMPNANGSVSAPSLSPQQAFNAYLTGNPNIAGEGPGAPVLAASAVTKKGVSTLGNGMIGQGGSNLAAVGTGDDRNMGVGKSTIAGKISGGSGVSTVASATGGGSQVVVQAKVERQVSNISSVGVNVTASNSGGSNPPGGLSEESERADGQNPYQPRTAGVVVRDSPHLRLLSTPNVTISGTTYQAIRKNYKKKEFQDELRGLGYAIELVDKNGKVLSTIGAELPQSATRRPSSIDSKSGSKNPGAPKAIFVDNGSSIKRKNP